MLLRNVLLLHHQSDYLGDVLLPTSVLSIDNKWIVEWNIAITSPCSLPVHFPNIVLLHIRSCSFEEPIVWEPVWDENKKSMLKQCKGDRTIFSRKAFAKCCAPSSPNRHLARFRVVNVCITRRWEMSTISLFRRSLTLFIFNALVKCFIPSSPILLFPRFNVSSVCIN